MGPWASLCLLGPRLTPCCNRVFGVGHRIQEPLALAQVAYTSQAGWRKRLCPRWSQGDTHLMFQNHHCGHKLPHYLQTQRLWLGRPWYLRVLELTPALTRQVWRPQVSKFSLQRPGRLEVLSCSAVLLPTAWHSRRVYLGSPLPHLSWRPSLSVA